MLIATSPSTGTTMIHIHPIRGVSGRARLAVARVAHSASEAV
jgi:hypothetical protein